MGSDLFFLFSFRVCFLHSGNSKGKKEKVDLTPNHGNSAVRVRRGVTLQDLSVVASRLLRCLGEHGANDAPRLLACAFRALHSLAAVMFLVGLLSGEILAARHTLEIVVWHDIASQFAPPKYHALPSSIPLAAWKAMGDGGPASYGRPCQHPRPLLLSRTSKRDER